MKQLNTKKLYSLIVGLGAAIILGGALIGLMPNLLGFALFGIIVIAVSILAIYYITPKLSSPNPNRSKKKNKIMDINPPPSQADTSVLLNRFLFNTLLNKAISHAKRNNKICAVLLLGIYSPDRTEDIFSKTVTKELGRRITKALRAHDIVGKLSDKEYIILLNDIEKTKFASAVAEKLLYACANPITTADGHIIINLNIGIVIYPNDGDSLETLLTNVDIALNKAKLAGINTYEFYTKALDLEAREFKQLANDLRTALQNNEIILHYQPQLDIKKGRITGVEALIRWTHPRLGLISSNKLIELAEETGFILTIGEWAIREACKTNKHWQQEGYEHITVSVNLSPKQFYHPDLVTLIKNILETTQLDPSYLELEINEVTIMDDSENAEKILNSLKELGINIAVDHFGTGYTSISHLKQFPLSKLKIDKFFIKGLPYTPNDIAITNAFISLGHHLGIAIVAEGVETDEQVQYLSSQQCDIIQGYFISYPLPADKMINQLKKLSDEVIIS